MIKKIFFALLGLFLLGCNDTKVSVQEPLKTGILEATAYAKILPTISKTPMLLEFGSTSCASCVEMGKLLHRAKQEYPKSAIYFIEVYNDKEATGNYKIQMIPTQVYLNQEGFESDRHIGLVSYEQLIAKLKEHKII